jgi:hypothetical protein
VGHKRLYRQRSDFWRAAGWDIRDSTDRGAISGGLLQGTPIINDGWIYANIR